MVSVVCARPVFECPPFPLSAFVRCDFTSGSRPPQNNSLWSRPCSCVAHSSTPSSQQVSSSLGVFAEPLQNVSHVNTGEIEDSSVNERAQWSQS
ncbi:hypothetical protein BD310DRAFT_914364 [Dichomitus squalens]|uniref:Uncharacterized protein n=1 Tax=Dichomitus squalens TaxID=114155 RepID=A0A4Q9Q9J2_9APHY|nr:hypothetical protein BD310DRAFT_914364 [Dichomitus squalens]